LRRNSRTALLIENHRNVARARVAGGQLCADRDVGGWVVREELWDVGWMGQVSTWARKSNGLTKWMVHASHAPHKTPHTSDLQIEFAALDGRGPGLFTQIRLCRIRSRGLGSRGLAAPQGHDIAGGVWWWWATDCRHSPPFTLACGDAAELQSLLVLF
jgi:hypothetical protein